MATHYAVAIIVAFVCGFFFYKVTNDIPGFQCVPTSPETDKTGIGHKLIDLAGIASACSSSSSRSSASRVCHPWASSRTRGCCLCERGERITLLSIAHVSGKSLSLNVEPVVVKDLADLLGQTATTPPRRTSSPKSYSTFSPFA